MTQPLLQVKNLATHYQTYMGDVEAVRGVSFTLNKGETIGIVGESGSGKSSLVLSIMKLLDPSGKIQEGEIYFKGDNLLAKSEKQMRSIRGRQISMIFQNSKVSLNPIFTVGNQFIEFLMTHQKIKKKQALDKTLDMLALAGIRHEKEVLKMYPHELSGGMCQKVLIAMALALKPALFIADEPTSALDTTVQFQILGLLKELKQKEDMSMLLISHDLGAVANSSNKIMVMYGGMILEMGEVEEIFYHPKHPYTKGLMDSIPNYESDKNKGLSVIEGEPPNLLNPKNRCPFVTRCSHAMNICLKERPEYFMQSDTHYAMCWLLHPELTR